MIFASVNFHSGSPWNRQDCDISYHCVPSSKAEYGVSRSLLVSVVLQNRSMVTEVVIPIWRGVSLLAMPPVKSVFPHYNFIILWYYGPQMVTHLLRISFYLQRYSGRSWNIDRPSGKLLSRFGEGQQNVQNKGPNVPWNFGSYQYLMYKRD